MQTITIFFSIHYETKIGQEIYISANNSELGNWDIKNAKKLNWTNGHIWKNQFNFFYNYNEEFQYKYVMISQEGSLWEDGQNRNFKAIKGQDFSIEDIWNHQKILIKIINNKSENNNIFIKLIQNNQLNQDFYTKMYQKIKEKNETVVNFIEVQVKLKKLFQEYQILGQKNIQIISLKNCLKKKNFLKHTEDLSDKPPQIIKIYDQLVLGNFQEIKENLQKIKKYKITKIIDIINYQSEVQIIDDQEIEVRYFQKLIQKFQAINSIIDQWIKENQIILVNSKFGINLTIKLLCDYLIQFKHFQTQAAMQYLQRGYQKVSNQSNNNKIIHIMEYGHGYKHKYNSNFSIIQEEKIVF